MADLYSLADLVRPFVFDCPHFVVQNQLRRAAREFFEKTKLWTEVKAVQTSIGVRVIDVSVGAGEVIGVEAIELIDGDRSEAFSFVKSRRQLFRPPGRPRVASVDANMIVSVGPLPDAVYDLEVTLTLKPSLAQTDVPDALLGRWGEVIAEGAAAYVLQMHDAEWSNIPLSELHMKAFRKGITSVRNEEAAQFNDVSERMHSPYRFN